MNILKKLAVIIGLFLPGLIFVAMYKTGEWLSLGGSWGAHYILLLEGKVFKKEREAELQASIRNYVENK